jgi:hypothetical protein
VLAAPGVARRRTRGRRLADGSAGALWEELLATAVDLGIDLPDAGTTRQVARDRAEHLAAAEPAAVPAVRALALAQEREVYGPPATAAPDPASWTALRTARRALLRRASRSRRLRAA